MRTDLEIISQWINPSSRVLDLGCGDGELLHHLIDRKKISGLGLEIDQEKIVECVKKGVPVVCQDLNKKPDNFEDQSFDTVMMTQSLQQMKRPDHMLVDLCRIGSEAIVTFPNFGHWTTRKYLGIRGRMPMSEALPYMWYDTPNIHLCTFKDFELLCQDKGIAILDRMVVDDQHRSRWFINLFPNLMGEIAIYRIKKK